MISGESLTRGRGDVFLRSSSGGLGVTESVAAACLLSMMSRSVMILAFAAQTKIDLLLFSAAQLAYGTNYVKSS